MTFRAQSTNSMYWCFTRASTHQHNHTSCQPASLNVIAFTLCTCLAYRIYLQNYYYFYQFLWNSMFFCLILYFQVKKFRFFIVKIIYVEISTRDSEKNFVYQRISHRLIDVVVWVSHLGIAFLQPNLKVHFFLIKIHKKI